jgi:integrase
MVQIHYQVIGMAMRWWWKQYQLPTRVPIDDVEPPQAPEPRSLQSPWDHEEIGMFLASARAHSSYFPLYAMAMGVPVRAAELCGLTRPDVDLLNGCVTIRRQLYRLYGPQVDHPGLVVKEPKKATWVRPLPLPRRVAQVLRDLFAAQDDAMRRLDSAYAHAHELANGKVFTAISSSRSRTGGRCGWATSPSATCPT